MEVRSGFSQDVGRMPENPIPSPPFSYRAETSLLEGKQRATRNNQTLAKWDAKFQGVKEVLRHKKHEISRWFSSMDEGSDPSIPDTPNTAVTSDSKCQADKTENLDLNTFGQDVRSGGEVGRLSHVMFEALMEQARCCRGRESFHVVRFRIQQSSNVTSSNHNLSWLCSVVIQTTFIRGKS